MQIFIEKILQKEKQSPLQYQFLKFGLKSDTL